MILASATLALSVGLGISHDKVKQTAIVVASKIEFNEALGIGKW